MTQAQQALGMIPADDTNSKLLELQKQATSMQKEDRDAQWAGITSYNLDEIPPLMMAKLYAALYSLTIPHAIMLAITARRRKLNPEDGDIYVLPSGKIGTSLQGTLKEAKIAKDEDGKIMYKLSSPSFSRDFREWPAGKKLRTNGAEFALPKEPGVTCKININGQDVEYQAWLTEWYMEKNPNWYNRMDWMLHVSAEKRCLALGTGISISEDIVDVDATSPKEVASKEVRAPKDIPTGIRQANINKLENLNKEESI